MRSQEFRAEYERIQKEEDNRIVDPDMLDAWKLGFDEGCEDAQAG